MENVTYAFSPNHSNSLVSNSFLKEAHATSNTYADVSQQVSIDHGTVSAATFNLFNNILIRGFLVLGVLAIVFSMTNACVYSQQRHLAFAAYLLGVNIGDALYSGMELVQSASVIMLPSGSLASTVIGFYLYSFLSISFSRAAISLNALASLERFTVVAFPLKVTKTCNEKVSPGTVVAFVFVGSLIGHSYLLLEFEIRAAGIQTDNATDNMWYLTPTALRSQNLYSFEIVKNVVRTIFTYVPLLGSFLLNLCLVVAIHRHVIQRRAIRTARGGVKYAGKISAQKKSETQTTKLILVFTFTFLLLFLPFAVNSTLASLLPSYGVFKSEHYLYWLVSRSTLTLTYVTEIVQFCVCFLYSRQFRVAFYKMPLTRALREKYAKSFLSDSATEHISFDERNEMTSSLST